MIANISVYCPPMEIYKIDRNHRQTASEPMTATITFPDYTKITISPVTIPATNVTRQRLLNWLVDGCTGSTPHGASPSLMVYLPPELVLFRWWKWFPTMVAQPIDARTALVLANNEVWTGTIHFPACPINILRNPMLAAAITAVGKLSS